VFSSRRLQKRLQEDIGFRVLVGIILMQRTVELADLAQLPRFSLCDGLSGSVAAVESSRLHRAFMRFGHDMLSLLSRWPARAIVVLKFLAV